MVLLLKQAVLFGTLLESSGQILYHLSDLNQHDSSPVDFSQDISDDIPQHDRNRKSHGLQQLFFWVPPFAFCLKTLQQCFAVKVPANRYLFYTGFQHLNPVC